MAAAGEGQGTCGQCTRWRASCSTCSGRLSVIMQRQVLQSCTESVTTSGWCLSFSSSTEFFLVVNRDRYPQFSFFGLGFGVLQYIDKVVDVTGDAVALWRLVKEFHIFSTCSRCLLGIWTLFVEPLVLAATCPCALRQSTAAFGRMSSTLYVKSGLGAPRAVLTWNSEHYSYEQYLAVPRASVYGAFGRISHIFNVTVDSDFPAQFALENLYIISTCSHMAVGGVFRRL